MAKQEYLDHFGGRRILKPKPLGQQGTVHPEVPTLVIDVLFNSQPCPRACFRFRGSKIYSLTSIDPTSSATAISMKNMPMSQ